MGAGDASREQRIFVFQPGHDFGNRDGQCFDPKVVKRLYLLDFKGDFETCFLRRLVAAGDGFEVAGGEQAVAGGIELRAFGFVADLQTRRGDDPFFGKNPVTLHGNRIDWKRLRLCPVRSPGHSR